jgi:purine-cytosine permease-like protein
VSIGTLIRNILDSYLPFRFANSAWIPALVVFIVAAGVNGKNFVKDQKEHDSVIQIFNFASTVSGFTLSWSTISSDYTAYFHPNVPRFVQFHGCLLHRCLMIWIKN